MNILQTDPFPDPTHAGQEIENIGFMFSELTLIIFLILLMLFFYMKIKDATPMILLFIFSLVIGIQCLQKPAFPFYPWSHILFILLQLTFLILKLNKKW